MSDCRKDSPFVDWLKEHKKTLNMVNLCILQKEPSLGGESETLTRVVGRREINYLKKTSKIKRGGRTRKQVGLGGA